VAIVSPIKGCMNAPISADEAEMACIEGTIPSMRISGSGWRLCQWASAGSGVLLGREWWPSLRVIEGIRLFA
jgi:hypothetical protein